MVGLMMEIKNLKERNKNLSDEERRKNAEEMILKLSKYMNLDEGDFEDEDCCIWSKYFRVLKNYKYLINIIY